MAKRGTKEWRENVSMSRVGIATHDFTKSSREKLRLRKLGELNPNWRGGITPGNKSARESAQYKEWRKGVFKRDNYTCVLCGDNKGGNLEADHIKPFALFKEFRYEISNGRTLCKPCHRKTETWGSLTPAHLN